MRSIESFTLTCPWTVVLVLAAVLQKVYVEIGLPMGRNNIHGQMMSAKRRSIFLKE